MGLKNFKEIEIKKLILAEWNYKLNNDELLEKLKENISKNGQIENMLVRKTKEGYEVVNGNHRLMALRDLGIEKAIVYDLGEISIAKAKRIAIETNETRFETDFISFAKIMEEIVNEFSIEELVNTVPYTEEQLNQLVNMNSYDFEQWDDKPEKDEDKIIIIGTYDEIAEIRKMAGIKQNFAASAFKELLER